MAVTISCPHCQKSLRVRADKVGAKVKCPACGRTFQITLPGDDEFDDLVDSPASAAAPAPRGKRTSTARGPYPINSFIKTWAKILGGIVGFAVVVGLVGLASETAAMVATGICVAAIVGCVAFGRTWMSIDLGRGALWQGLVSFFVPLVGFVFTLKQRGPSQRGAIVYLSSLIPAVAALGLMLMFKPLYTSEGRAAARSESAEERLRQFESRVDSSQPAETVTYEISGRLENAGSASTAVDSLLSAYSMYVPGSAVIDASTRTLTVETRGGRGVVIGYALLIRNSLGLSVRPPLATQAEPEPVSSSE